MALFKGVLIRFQLVFLTNHFIAQRHSMKMNSLSSVFQRSKKCATVFAAPTSR